MQYPVMSTKCHSSNSSACGEISEQGPVSKKYLSKVFQARYRPRVQVN